MRTLHGCVQIGKLDFPHVRQHSQLVEIVADGFLLPQDFFQSVKNDDFLAQTTTDYIVALAHVRLNRFLADCL